MAVLPFHPNPNVYEQVSVLAGLGATDEFIAEELGIPLPIIKQHYSQARAMGEEKANMLVAKAFHEMATSGEHPAMTASWMKMRAKWQETSRLTIEEPEDSSLAREKLLALVNRDSATKPTPIK